MLITRDFKETINARVQREPEFAKALLDEAASLFLNGEPETARLILRDVELASKSPCNSNLKGFASFVANTHFLEPILLKYSLYVLDLLLHRCLPHALIF